MQSNLGYLIACSSSASGRAHVRAVVWPRMRLACFLPRFGTALYCTALYSSTMQSRGGSDVASMHVWHCKYFTCACMHYFAIAPRLTSCRKLASALNQARTAELVKKTRLPQGTCPWLKAATCIKGCTAPDTLMPDNCASSHARCLLQKQRQV